MITVLAVELCDNLDNYKIIFEIRKYYSDKDDNFYYCANSKFQDNIVYYTKHKHGSIHSNYGTIKILSILFISIAMNSKDQCKIIRFLKISHFKPTL